MPTKKIVFALLAIPILLAITPFATAMPDPFATLTVWPYNTPEGAQGPLVNTSPADLIIYNNDNSHVLDDVWLMLVINQLAYDNLIDISTNTSLSFLPAYFEEIPASASPDTKIPPYQPASGIDPTPPYAYRPNEWPGIEPGDQYDVGSLRSKLGTPSGQSIWYSVGDLDSSSGWEDHGPPGLNKGDPEYFTLTVNVGGFAGDWKVLVLALGHSNDFLDNHILNVHSPYTRSTLVIVSEPGTILLAIASVSILGLYKITHKTKRKKTQEFSS